MKLNGSNEDDAGLERHAPDGSLERMQLTLAATHQGWFDLDLRTGEATVNEQYAVMLGYDPATFTETVADWQQRVHPDDSDLVLKALDDYLAGCTPECMVEFRERRRDGRWIWVSARGAIVRRDRDGKPLRLVGTQVDITERKEIERRQQETDQRLAFALDAAHLGDWNMDLRTNVAWRSPQHDRCFGYAEPVAEWGYETFLAHVLEPDRARVHDTYTAAMFGEGVYDVEFRVRWPDGSHHWLWSKGRFYHDEDGKPYRVAGIVTDITERKKAEAALLAGEARYRLLLESSMDAILQAGPDGTILSGNPAACAMFGCSAEQLLRMRASDLFDPEDQRMTELLETRAATGRARGEVTMLRADGSTFEAEVTTALYSDLDGAMVTSVIARDITERRQWAAEIRQLAYFDPLTGLPNRRWLMGHLHAAHEAARHEGHTHALLYLDLDHFKLINDTRGHAVGDVLLRTVASRIRETMGGDGTVGRLGGDEFIMHIANATEQPESMMELAWQKAEQVSRALQQPMEINGQLYSATGSIGITLFPRGDSNIGDSLREADTAMYRAKAAGRNRIAVFETAMRTELESRMALERDLAQALEKDQLSLHCQPQICASGRVDGAELLLRWHHPERGRVPPDDFIGLAEESDLILRIGSWVIHSACLIEVQTRNMGLDLPLSVNVSPKQFKQPDFVSQVRKSLAATRANAQRLIFEVTEGLFIEDLAETIERMHALRDLGIRFSIDDFGTGYSSLAYLKQLPLYELKIDRQFVQDIPADGSDSAIVHSIALMAKQLRLRVVAEGVETQEQARLLRAWGCDCLQGYLLARPMPVDEFLGEGDSS